MIQLTEQQVEYILNDIRRNGIELEELQYNLLDHICCVIESEMPPQNNFEEFYRSILPRFFKRELREIQEETNLLLKFKNYYTMKKLLIYSGIASAITTILGSLFKIMHWPGASIMLVLSVVFMCFIFLPVFLVIKTKETDKTLEKLVIIIGCVFGILLSFSVLFKVMHWPYANKLWTTSLAILGLVFLPIYYLNGIRKEDNKVNTIVSSVLILAAGSLLFMLTNIRSSQRTEDIRFNDNMFIHQQYISSTEINNNLYISNGLDSIEKCKTIKEKTDKLCSTIEGIKTEIYNVLVQAFEGANSYQGVMNNSKARDNYGLTEDFLFNENGEPNQALQELQKVLIEYNSFVQSEIKLNAKVSLQRDSKINKEWIKEYFYQIPTESILKNLTKLQVEARYIEAISLK